ncbi:hypothetical protein GE061_019339 [Apolygus lucorum]|uniref:Uncharacterized protein n=1 Tax=Apolygus lucorum TaxID=248454 RepID=A0A8S9X864_APOLU|nr:hypothetical protein GE061_019339 [Apolygus lucorum]
MEPRLSSLKPGDSVLAQDYRTHHPPWVRGQVTNLRFGKVAVSVEGRGEVERHRDQLLPVGQKSDSKQRLSKKSPESPPFRGFEEEKIQQVSSPANSAMSKQLKPIQQLTKDSCALEIY